MQNQKKMNDFIDKKIQEYVEISSQSEPELLKKLTKEIIQTHLPKFYLTLDLIELHYVLNFLKNIIYTLYVHHIYIINT